MFPTMVCAARLRTSSFLPSIVYSYSLRTSAFLPSVVYSYSTLTKIGSISPYRNIDSTKFHPLERLTILSTFQLRSVSHTKSLTVEDVKHWPENKEFTVSLPSTPVAAYLKYREIGPNLVDMYTTVVPKEMEGRGVAKLLAQAAFNFAVDNDIKMKLTCWYLAGYLERNPKEMYLKQMIQD